MESIRKAGDWVLNHISDLSGKNVLVVGDVGLDVYILGDVRRLSPEAPVPILDVATEDQRLGLSANVALNINALGGSAHLISVVGKDQSAEDLKHLFKNGGVSSLDLIVDEQRPTTRKMRLLAGQHHIARVDFEKQNFLSDEVRDLVLKKVAASIETADIIILQDYAKGMIDQKLAQDVIQLAQKLNKKVLVDPYKTTSLSHYKGAYLMTPNQGESVSLAKQLNYNLSEDSSQVDEVGQTLMKGIQSEQMVVTLGPAGMKLFEKGQIEQLPTFAQDVFDVTGAGDTVISAIALGLAAGWSLTQACYLANFAAGVVVGQIGCVPCHIEDLRAFIEKH